jgi:hypothetical protein
VGGVRCRSGGTGRSRVQSAFWGPGKDAGGTGRRRWGAAARVAGGRGAAAGHPLSRSAQPDLYTVVDQRPLGTPTRKGDRRSTW